MHLRNFLTFLLLIYTSCVSGQKFFIKNSKPETDASFRGLSVVDDSVAWVSGSKGWVGASKNGGRNWNFKKVPGFEQLDFRTIYAFDEKAAVIANAGAPAYILRTTDGGASWTVVYENDDSAAFIDGIDFWNGRDGIIYGDPIGGRMLLLRTADGGKHWKPLQRKFRPLLENGEASFAASGTAIRCIGRKKAVIATGGKVSRLWISADKGKKWEAVTTPMSPVLNGDYSSRGIFSVAYTGDSFAIIVGGDYKKESLKFNHVFYTENGGKTWLPPDEPTGGYRECVEFIDNKNVVATGPSGTDVSLDRGGIWNSLSDEGFHVVRKSRKGNTVILAGGQGRIALLQTAK